MCAVWVLPSAPRRGRPQRMSCRRHSASSALSSFAGAVEGCRSIQRSTSPPSLSAPTGGGVPMPAAKRVGALAARRALRRRMKRESCGTRLSAGWSGSRSSKLCSSLRSSRISAITRPFGLSHALHCAWPTCSDWTSELSCECRNAAASGPPAWAADQPSSRPSTGVKGLADKGFTRACDLCCLAASGAAEYPSAA